MLWKYIILKPQRLNFEVFFFLLFHPNIHCGSVGHFALCHCSSHSGTHFGEHNLFRTLLATVAKGKKNIQNIDWFLKLAPANDTTSAHKLLAKAINMTSWRQGGITLLYGEKEALTCPLRIYFVSFMNWASIKMATQKKFYCY